ncbi:hypothetical protein RB595_000346 [Gaeumannomyces hyphopodioides]
MGRSPGSGTRRRLVPGQTNLPPPMDPHSPTETRESTRLLEPQDNTNGAPGGCHHEGSAGQEDGRARRWAGKVGAETLRAAKGTLFCSWANVLIFCIPLGVVAANHDWDDTWTFILNFLAIFPLAEIISWSTEELSMSVGQIFGGLINATFGNAVEMIVGITALKQNQIGIVQSAMVGSILSGMLLILGTCFLASGFGKSSVGFNVEVAGIMSSLMIVSSAALVIPSALFAVSGSGPGEPDGYILTLSRATSIVLFTFYVAYLYFSVKSHRDLFSEEEPPDREPLHPVSAMTVLIAATVAVSVCSDCLVDSVDGFVANLNISKAFIGLIVVPIVGNAGEFASTVKWSMNDKLGLAISVIVGSTLQIALLVTPFMVMVGWALQKDMSLKFNAFQTLTVALSVLVVNGLVRDGRTNYFEGSLLIVAYLVIAIAFFVYPEDIGSIMLEQG